jgi:hypothetical protein
MILDEFPTSFDVFNSISLFEQCLNHSNGLIKSVNNCRDRFEGRLGLK